MHIEPGLVSEAKIALSYATAAGAGGFLVVEAAKSMREKGPLSFLARAAAATAAVLVFFQLLPHPPVGPSEVHFILGSTLFLILGAAPAALGLALGLLLQGIFFEPKDIPQYAMNVTTLLVPLFALKVIADRIIAPGTAYVDLSYKQTLALSTAYQGGIIAWVAFWILYGKGVNVESLQGLAMFGAAYASVIILEPIVDLAVLGLAKATRGLARTGLVTPRLYNAA